MSEKKCVRIEIEYDDGTVEYQQGDAANQIMKWYHSCEVMNWIHGAHYDGPKFEERKTNAL